MRKLLLVHARAPGDILVMSALVRDIALTHSDKFEIYVHTTANELWRNNPYTSILTAAERQQDVEQLRLDYGPALNQVGTRNRHFLLGFHESFERQTGVHVPLLYPRPDYHLDDKEKHVPLVSGRYWVILSGGKSDFITKHWVYKRNQQVVNLLRGMGIHCVQLGAVGGLKLYHHHPRLENALCLIGLTSLRDMARIIQHAEGVICPVTCAMHMAAALQKPCVVLAGGREEWWWEAYVPGKGNFGSELREEVKIQHRYLHTMGQLDCCQRRGCWKNVVEGEKNACKYPCNVGGQLVPLCMDKITVNHVIEAVMSYYEDGILPPIGQPKQIVLIDGVPRVLKPGETVPDGPKSALAEALTLPEPQLLLPTAGIRALTGNST
jgi:ADP-heptose:LPS heptosyltransferase